MKAAVVGLGLFGRSLAVNLARAGSEVIAIDSSADLVEDIREEVAVAVRLDATDEKELRAQGVHEVDVLVASIGDNFESNQLLVLLAKKLGIPRVIARAPSSEHARILRLIGADEVIMPEEEAAKESAQRLIRPSLKGYFALIEGFSMAEAEAPASFHGKNLIELNLRQKYRVTIVAVKRKTPDGSREMLYPVPAPTDRIEAGDLVILIGADEDLQRLLEKELP